MAIEVVTKEDLQEFRIQLLSDLRSLMATPATADVPRWVRPYSNQSPQFPGGCVVPWCAQAAVRQRALRASRAGVWAAPATNGHAAQ